MNETYLQLALEFQRTKSEKSFTKLYNKILPGIKHYVYGIVKDRDVTDDIVSVTMTRIYTRIDEYDPTYQITTWAYKIALNNALQYIRKRNETISLSAFLDNGYEVDNDRNVGIGAYTLEADSDTSSEEYEMEDKKMQAQYELVIDEIYKLAPIYRDIMIDRFVYKLSYKEIEEKNNANFKNELEKRKYIFRETQSHGTHQQQIQAKFELQRFMQDNMITLQTIKNRINRGRMIVANKISGKVPVEVIDM